MTFPLAPVLGGGALAAAAYALYKHFSSTPSESTVKEAMAAYTTAGPRGERVFTRDAAQGILRSLPGMGYSYPDPKDSHLVEIHPEKGGTPPASGLSAADWVRAQNRRMSVLAPVYLPMPTGAPRYLRLAPPGHEAELAPYGYAVLAYADAYHRPSPGQPVTGRPPISPRKSAPVPTPVSAAYAETPPSLHAKLTDVLKKPIKPAEGRALASDLARAGMPAASAVVAAKTNNATMQAALGMPAVPPGTFAPGWIAQIQLLLNAMGEKLAVDDKLGPKTRAAIKIFKRMHGLPENDTADNATFAALTRAVGSRQAVVSNAPDGTSFVSPHVTANPALWGGQNAAAGSVVALATPSAAVQQALAALGLSPTYDGLKHFQASSGLPATGLIDAPTWVALQHAVSATGTAMTGAKFHQAFMSGKDQKAARKLASQAQGGDRRAMDQIRHDAGLPPGVNDKAKRIAEFAMHTLHQQNGQDAPQRPFGVPHAPYGAPLAPFGRPASPFGDHRHDHHHWDQSAGAADIDVVTVQQWLSKLNLIPFFAVTGQYDALTRQAIRSFQSARGLPANGLLDDRTAALLAQAARVQPQITSGFGLYSPPRQNIPLEPIIGPPWR